MQKLLTAVVGLVLMATALCAAPPAGSMKFNAYTTNDTASIDARIAGLPGIGGVGTSNAFLKLNGLGTNGTFWATNGDAAALTIRAPGVEPQWKLTPNAIIGYDGGVQALSFSSTGDGNLAGDLFAHGFYDTSATRTRVNSARAVAASNIWDAANVKFWGATGDGVTDDTLAISNAIAHGGRVFVPEGTFTFTPPISGFMLSNNTTIEGVGAASVLKVSSSAGDYDAVFRAAHNGATNFTFRNFRFDQNPTGNTNANIHTAAGYNQRVIYLYLDCQNILVDNVTFDPICGVNTVSVIGTNWQNTVVQNSRFHFVKGATSGAFYDNSAIYLEGPGQTVIGNTFTSDDCETNVAFGAIELHGGQAYMSGNHTTNYQTLVNVVTSSGGDFSPNNIQVVNNMATSAKSAICLWPSLGYTLSDVNVAGNIITINNASRSSSVTNGIGANFWGVGIPLSGANTGLLENVTISRNQVSFDTDQTDYGAFNGQQAGLWLYSQGPANNVIVEGNLIKNSPKLGVYAMFSPGATNLILRDNVIVDAGRNTTAGFRAGLFLGNKVHGQIKNNTFHDSTGAIGEYWISPQQTNGSQLLVAGNVMSTNLVSDVAFPSPVGMDYTFFADASLFTKLQATQLVGMVVVTSTNVGINTPNPISSAALEVGGRVWGRLTNTGVSMVGSGSNSNFQVTHDGSADVGLFNSAGAVSIRAPDGTNDIGKFNPDISTVLYGSLQVVKGLRTGTNSIELTRDDGIIGWNAYGYPAGITNYVSGNRLINTNLDGTGKYSWKDLASQESFSTGTNTAAAFVGDGSALTLATNTAPSAVTVGTTVPDIWFYVTNGGVGYRIPGWINH